MKKKQQFTPKYWIVHDKELGVVFLHTASQTKDRSIQKHIDLYGEWDEEGDYDCSLFELNMVKE